jgi:type II secretory pathway pseudopilin PulG
MLNSGFAVIAIAALLAGAALQIVLALAGYRARRQERSQAALIRDLQKELLGLQQEVHALRRQSVPLGRQEPTVALPSMPAPMARREPASPAYELASKLARKGASSEELMDTCGLSRGEVDLITMLNRMGQEAKDRSLAVSA